MLTTVIYHAPSLIWKSTLAGAASLLFVLTSEAGNSLERLSVIALAPVEGQAVISLPDGRMQVVQPGERLLGDTLTVIQVLADKLVVEEHLAPGTTPASKRLVWIYQAPMNGGYSRVMRLEQQAPTADSAALSTKRFISATQP